MAINRALNPKQLVPGLHSLFGESYDQVETTWTKLFDVETSDRAYEESVKLGSFGLVPVKAEGSAVTYDEFGEEYTARWYHKTYARGFMLTEEAMDDNLYERTGRRYARALGRSMAITKEIEGSSIFNNGFSASYLGGDNVALFSASHPVGNYTNSNTASVDLTESALKNMYVALAGWKDSGGKIFKATPRLLMVHPSDMDTAERLLKSTHRVDSANNDVNFIQTSNLMPDGYMVNHYLTDTDAWFVKTNVQDGLLHFKRKGMTKRMVEDEDTFTMKFIYSERYSFGWGDPLAVYGSQGA